MYKYGEKKMTTPKRQDIIDKAFEMNARQNHKINLNNPEIDELLENGDFEKARNSLMRSETRQYKDYVEKEARSLGLLKDESIDMSKHACKLSYDFEEQKKSNTLITGMNQVGKSRLAMLLASTLRENDFNVIAFDNSGSWKDVSDLPNYNLVSKENKANISPSRNMLLDISLLRPSDQRTFVDQVLEYFWLSHVNANSKEWQIIILEEFQLYGRWLRGRLSENIYRIMSVGANQKIRIIAITPSMSLIDPLFIRLCSQRFHFKLSIEENSLRKFRRYYGGDFTKIVQNLDVGFCLHYLKGKIRIVKVPLFKGIEKVIVPCR